MTSATNKNDRGAGTSAAVAPSNRKASAMSSVRDWDDLVERGRQLKIQEERIEAEAGNIRWQWGDLLLDVAPLGSAGDHSGVDERLRQYADELDVEFETIRKYRYVAGQWPIGMRFPNQPWSVHQLFAAREDREEAIRNPVDVRSGEVLEKWTFRAAQRFLGNKPSPHYRKPPATTEEKVEAASELLRDPDVADAIYGVNDEPEQTAETPRPEVDPEVQRNLREAQIKARQQMADRVRAKKGADEKLGKLGRELEAVAQIGKAREALKRSLADIERLVNDGDFDRMRNHVRIQLEGLLVLADWIQHFVDSESSTLDDELVALLQERGQE